MTRTTTLRGRLALVAAGTTALWVGVLTLGFNLVLATQLHSQASTLLRQRAGAAAATIVVAADGTVRVREAQHDEALDTNLWIYAGTKALERPRGGSAIQRQADLLAGRGQRFAQTAEPHATRFFALPVHARGQQVATVVSAVALDPYRDVARLALLGSIGLAVLLLGGVYAATRLLVARALRPVHVMSTQAARWSEVDAAQRFGREDRPGELALLASNLDGVLDRLEALLRHEQRVTEELSHELRTPLSLITAETELLRARRRTGPETDAAVDRIADAANHLSSILETLLTAARSRSAETTGRCLVLPAAQRAVDRSPSGSTQVLVRSEDDDLAVGIDAEVVERMLSPLLDNALRYATSRVDVDIRPDDSMVVMRVSDDGPGVDPALGAAVFEPGRRDPQTSPHGAGLGLALARRLARAAGGDLVLADGGFEIRMPRA